GGAESNLLLLLDVRVGLLLQALVAEYPDQPLVQDVVAERLRRSMARDQPEGIERDRRGAIVDDLVLDGEEILVVDRNGAAELEPLAVVVDERHRVAERERARALLLPQRIRSRQLHRRAARRRPAEFGVERMRAARGREQDDRWRIRVDSLADRKSTRLNSSHQIISYAV